METALALTTGIMVAGSVYLMLDKQLVKFIFGLVLAGNAVNLLIFAAGRTTHTLPPLIEQGARVPAAAVANSLPQALILTAIVIGFSLLAFIFILFFRAYQALGTIDTEAMTAAVSDTPGDPSRQGGGA